MVLDRECRIRAWASFTSAPAIFSQVACEVRRRRQFTKPSPIFLAAGLMCDVLKKFVKDMKREGLSNRTIANRVANVVCFLREHDSDVSITHRYVEKTVKAYREDEVRAFFTACLKYPELWLLFQFLLCTGAWEQEVMYAEYADIDFRNGIYTVTEKANWRPKDFEEREIPIPTHLVEALRERKKTATSKLLFPTPSDNPEGHMLRHLKGVVKEAGLSGHWELHKWRKTYATLQARDAVDIKILQQQLGHSDLETHFSHTARQQVPFVC